MSLPFLVEDHAYEKWSSSYKIDFAKRGIEIYIPKIHFFFMNQDTIL